MDLWWWSGIYCRVLMKKFFCVCVSVSGVLILMGSRDGKVRTMLIYVCEMDLLY